MGTVPHMPTAARLRSTQVRMDSLADSAFLMETAVSTKQGRAGAAAAEQESGAGTLGDFLNLLGDDAQGRRIDDESEAGGQDSRSNLRGTMQQVEKLQTDIAGMEAVVEAVRGYYNKRTVTGRHLPKLVSKASMRKRAQELIKLRHEQLIGSSRDLAKLKESERQLAPLQFDVFFQPVHSHKLPLSDTKESCSRQDAQLLVKHLDDVIPEGAIKAKYCRAIGDASDALQLYHDVLKIKHDYVVVDAILRESGRHLAAECLERAHVTEKVRNRYAEMFNAVFYVLCIMEQTVKQTKVKHDEMISAWQDMEQELRVAKAKAAMEKRLREEGLATVEAEREQLNNLTATLTHEMAVVHQENQNLSAALKHEVDSFNSKMKAKDEATALAQHDLQVELETARGDCEDLQRQLQVTERQLARLRRPKEVDMGKSVKATQTEQTRGYQPIAAQTLEVDIESEIHPDSSQGHESEDDIGHREGSREHQGDEQDANSKDKKSSWQRIRRGVASDKVQDGEDPSAAQGYRTARGVRSAQGCGMQPGRTRGVMTATSEIVSLHRRTQRPPRNQGGASTSKSAHGAKRSGRRVKSAPGAANDADDVGSNGESELFDSYEDLEEEDLSEMDSFDGSDDEEFNISEEEVVEDIEKVLAAMDAEQVWDDEDSDEENCDSDVTGADQMDQEELHTVREEQRRIKQEQRAARKLEKRQAWREANILAHEENMKALAEAKARKVALQKMEKEARREQRKAAKLEHRKRQAQLRRERQALARARREEEAEKKARNNAVGSKHATAKPERTKPSAGISRKAFKTKRQTAKVTDVGGFSGMVKARAKGRVKGIAWLMKQVVSIYADYLVQQKYMSRDGEAGQFDSFNHYVYKWHMSQFGLKQIAEMNLIDLIATVRANASKHHQLQVFGKVIHILAGARTEGSLDHLDYYLFCIRAFAGKKPMQTLFTADGTVNVATMLVVAGVKAVCLEWLRDDAAKDSLIKQLDIKDAMKGTVSVPAVMQLLMAAFQRKYSLSQLHQAALMKAVDLDRDGLIDWEGFSMAARVVQQGVWGKDKDENDVLQAFHGACRLSKRHSSCTVQHGTIKLRAHLGRLWSLEHCLPTAEMILNEEGVPVLPATWGESMQQQLDTIGANVQQTVQGDPNSAANVKLIALFQSTCETVDLCIQGQEDMEVGFCSLHVLQACSASMYVQSAD